MPINSVDAAMNFIPTQGGGAQPQGDMKRMMLAKALMNRGQKPTSNNYGAVNAVSDIGSGVMNGMMMNKFMGA